MQPFNFDRAKAEQSLADPDGTLWPVNAYSDADELDSLVQAALDCGAIARPNSRARLYVYPLSLSEPDPVLVYDPGHGRAFLGHALKLFEREGESPLEFTLRLLEELTAEANGLVAAPSATARAQRAGENDRDAMALDLLATRLDGVEWSADTAEDVAAIVRGSGREVRDPDELRAADQRGEDGGR